MKYNVTRWETPISDLKEVYFLYTRIYREEDGSANLIFALHNKTTVFEFVFTNPFAYLVHTEEIMNDELCDEVFRIKPGFTFTLSNSELENAISVSMVQTNNRKNDYSRFWENYYVDNSDISLEVLTTQKPYINQYNFEDYKCVVDIVRSVNSLKKHKRVQKLIKKVVHFLRFAADKYAKMDFT